jgi:hypothetical protein
MTVVRQTMLRIAVTSYLLLTIMAGPWLCCCNVARLATLLQSSTEPAAKGCHRSQCCQHQAARHQGSEPAAPSQPKPEPAKPCPCNENHPVATSADSTGQEIVRQLERGLPSVSPFISLIGLDPTCHINFRHSLESQAFPYLTGREILQTLQTYLC